MTPDSRLRSRVDEIVAAFERRDAARLAELVHPDAVIEPLPSPQPLRGKQEVSAYLGTMKERLATVQLITVHDLSDEAVMIEGREQYQDAAGWMYDRPAAWIVEFRDGMIWRTRSFASPDAALVAWHDGPATA